MKKLIIKDLILVNYDKKEAKKIYKKYKKWQKLEQLRQYLDAKKQSLYL